MTPLQNIPPWAIAIILCLLIATFTECTSNVATATLFLPVLASMVSYRRVWLVKKLKQTQTESQLQETVNYVDWFSDVKCYIVYFVLKQFPQLECSIETTPCGDRPIFPRRSPF